MGARAALLKATDAAVGPACCSAVTVWRYAAGRDAQPPPAALPPAPRLLVIRPGGLGDMLLLLPALQALEAALPGARLDLLCERRNAAVPALAGRDGAVLCYDTNPWRTWRTLRRARYDAVIDTEQFHHFSAVMALATGAPVRIGFNINPRRNPLYTHLVSYDPGGFEADQFLRLLAPLGIAARGAPAAGIRARADAPEADEARGAVILHPGASTPYKQWPPDRLAALGRALLEQTPHPVLVAGEPGERPLVEAVVRAIGRPDRVGAAYPADLRAAAALLRPAALFVGADTGLAHLAAALDVPLVVCFGPSDRHKWGHAGPRRRVVAADIPCAPCFLFGYHKPCRHRRCIRRIEPATVLAACRDVLAETAATTGPHAPCANVTAS